MKHAKFGQKIEEVILEPLKMSVKLKAEAVDISYPSIVQSGGVYDLKASAVNDERPLQYDVVLIAIGGRFLPLSQSFPWNLCSGSPSCDSELCIQHIRKSKVSI